MISRLSSHFRTKLCTSTCASCSTLLNANIPFSAHPHTALAQKNESTTSTSTFQYHNLNQIRQMGIRTKPKNRTPHNKNKRTKKEDSTPINEHLVRILVRKSKTTAESIQVRLLVDQGRDEKPLIEVMSLTDAIGMSGEEGVDLVGINLNQDVPVVKCIDFNKFLYQQSKKGSSVKNPNAGKKSTKQFTFKAGIDDNDLQRKTDNMIGYLTKGHACQVTITSKGRFLKVDKDIVETTLERLKELVGDDGNPQGNMKKNEWGNRGSLLFQPNSKKKQT